MANAPGQSRNDCNRKSCTGPSLSGGCPRSRLISIPSLNLVVVPAFPRRHRNGHKLPCMIDAWHSGSVQQTGQTSFAVQSGTTGGDEDERGPHTHRHAWTCTGVYLSHSWKLAACLAGIIPRERTWGAWLDVGDGGCGVCRGSW